MRMRRSPRDRSEMFAVIDGVLELTVSFPNWFCIYAPTLSDIF